MTQPSKGAAAFLTLFGLPFLCAGLAFIYAQLVSRGNFGTFEFAMGIMVASVFVFIGGGLLYAPFRGYALLKQHAAREGSNPRFPWLRRADSASPRADTRNKKRANTMLVTCNLCQHV